MSTSLLEELGSYYGRIDELQDPISPEEVERVLERVLKGAPTVDPPGGGRLRRLSPTPRQQPRRRLITVAAAAAAVVLVSVPGFWLAGGFETERRPIASRGEIDPGVVLTWSQVRADADTLGGEFTHWMSEVAAAGPGLVVVGHVAARDSEPTDERAAVWISADGTSWSRAPESETFLSARMSGVTAGGPGLVAVGEAVRNGRGRAAVWTSTDGISWSQVAHDDTVFGELEAGPPRISSVTSGGPGLVAVGDVRSGQGASSNGVVWTSQDGTSWSRVPHDDEIFGRSEAGRCCTHMTDVVAGGPGLVAVGADWVGDEPGGSEDDGVSRAVVWTSSDGIVWSRVPHDEAVFGGASMSSVTVGGPGLVAVGAAEAGANTSVPAVWISADGLNWSRIPHDDAVFGVGSPASTGPIGTGLTAVAPAGPGLVAIGSGFLQTATSPAEEWIAVGAIWTSVDGVAWSRVPEDHPALAVEDRPETLMNDVTAGGPGVVVVGVGTVHDYWAAHNDSGESDAAVWVGEPVQ